MNLQQANQAQSEYDRAAIAFGGHLLDLAADHIERALKLDPDHSDARLLQARICLKHNRPQQALKALDAHDHIHQQMCQAPHVALTRIAALAGNGNNDLALNLLVKLNAQFPDDARIARMLSAHYLAMGQHDKAAAALEHALGLEPADQSSRRLLAQLQQQRPQQAIEWLTTSPDKEVDYIAKLRVARLCCQAQRLRDADEIYSELLEQHPNDQALWIEAGRLASALGDEEIALLRLEKAASIPGPQRQKATAELAMVHSNAGRFNCAAGSWWTVTRMQVDNAQAWAGLVVCANILGKKRMAQRAGKKLASCSSPHERQRLLHRHWLGAAGELAIQQAMDNSQATAPGPSPLNALLHDASITLDKVADQHPQRADAHYHRAVCHEALGRRDSAQQAVGRALSLNDHYSAARHLSNRVCVNPSLLP